MYQRGKINNRVLFRLLFFLLTFLMLANLFVSWQQRNIYLAMQENHVSNEMALISMLISDQIEKNDFIMPKNYLDKWADRIKDVVEIRVVGDNDFVMLHYKRNNASKYTRIYKKYINYDNHKTITIELISDYSASRNEYLKLFFKLSFFSFLVVLVFFLVLKNRVIKPLQITVENYFSDRRALGVCKDELSAVNQDLKLYSYTISHDLRAPLRSIVSFSRIIKEDSGMLLDKEGVSNLDRVIAAGSYMSKMISGLLELSRISAASVQREEVNISDLVTSALRRLKIADPARIVNFEIQPELVVNADKKLLEIVVDNILDNAWKYTSNEKKAYISFSQEMEEGHPVFRVGDNGVGFDMVYIDKIFSPFQRLHSSKEYTGMGLGLAMVMRIISLHGGRVWAEAEKGGGANISFTLGE